jgi:cytochrome c peroxidase
MRLCGSAALLVTATLFAGAVLARSPWAAAADAPVRAAPVEKAIKIALGRRLFYDADLSIDGSMACATCHEQAHGFADGNATHAGVTGEPGRRNVQTLANVARRKSLTWGDATIRSLEAQALVPIMGEHPVEMGMKGQEAVLARRLGANACYSKLFRAAFPEAGGAIDMRSVTGALAAFQRTLLSADAPADRFAKGETGALSPAARTGATLFRQNCASCHAGPDFTDDRFHRVRIEKIDDRDTGLGEITRRADDNGKFRTPGLRNVAVSAPYFHDGASRTLEAAIRRHRGIALKGEQEARVIAYLHALTDQTFLTDKRFAYPDEACEAS